MADLSAITNITPPRVPFIDARSGQIAREWYLFLFSQFSQSRALTAEVSVNTDVLAALQAELDATQAALTATQAELDVTQAEVSSQGLEIKGIEQSPTYTPHTPRLRYGSFYDTTTQIAAAPNTAYAITFNTADLSNGITRGSPTSRIYTDTPNVYNIQFSAQLDKTSGGVGIAWIWLRKNGADVTNSASQVRLQGNDAETVAAWNFLLQMNAGDYFELMWAVDTVDLQITTFAATAFHPAIPSVILTVTDNISA